MASNPTVLANQILPVDALVFDALVGLTVNGQSVVTEHPVELGSEMADHVQPGGDVLIFRGVVSGTQMLPKAPAPVEMAVAWFERNRKSLVVATTPKGIFNNCLIQSVNYDEEPGRVTFSVVLKQVRLVSPVAVSIPPRLPAPDVADGASTAANAGAQATTAVAGSAAPSPSFAATVLGL